MITDADIDLEKQSKACVREIAQMFADCLDHFEKRFDRLEKKMEEGFKHLNKHDRRLELDDDRITTLEIAVFKPSGQA